MKALSGEAEGSEHCGAVLTDTPLQFHMEVWDHMSVDRQTGVLVPIFKMDD